MSINNNILIAIVIVIVAITLVVILFGLKYLLASVPSDVGLPILAIGGVVMLLGTLALVSVAFSLFNLDDKSQALALPEGSIRAVIALSLIILFAIVTVYFYSTLSSTGVSTATGLSVTLRDSFLNSFKDQVVAVTPQTGDGPFTVYFRQGGNVAGADFAKQVLVLIGTLVTAVSSFYFASRVTTADGAPAAGVARSAPEIRGIAPQSQTRGAAGNGDQWQRHRHRRLQCADGCRCKASSWHTRLPTRAAIAPNSRRWQDRRKKRQAMRL